MSLPFLLLFVLFVLFVLLFVCSFVGFHVSYEKETWVHILSSGSL